MTTPTAPEALVHGYRAPFGRRPWIRVVGLTSSRQ